MIIKTDFKFGLFFQSLKKDIGTSQSQGNYHETNSEHRKWALGGSTD